MSWIVPVEFITRITCVALLAEIIYLVLTFFFTLSVIAVIAIMVLVIRYLMLVYR